MPLITPHVFDTPYITHPVPRGLIPPSSPTTTDSNGVEKEKINLLWVGCSDSSILETDCLDVPRDQMFIHRNLGHVLSNGDLSTQSALEWCVELLQVGDIVVCGHYGCTLVPGQETKIVNMWYKDAERLHDLNSEQLSEKDRDVDEQTLRRRFEERYVLAEVDWLKRQPKVQKAMLERRMKVHALIYDGEKGNCMQLTTTL